VIDLLAAIFVAYIYEKYIHLQVLIIAERWKQEAGRLLKSLPPGQSSLLYNKQIKPWAKCMVWFEGNWKHAWTLVYFFRAARTCIFRQFIIFHPNNLIHLRLCQHLQGAQVGSFCRMQIRPSDIVVSPDILRLF